MRAWLVGVLALSGCSAGVSKTVRAPQVPLQIQALLIAPVRITGTDAPGWRRFELAQRQVLTALESAGDQLAIYGPAQVQISRWDEVGWLGTNALPLLAKDSVSPDAALLLRTTAEQRVASQMQEREDAAGKAKGGLASQETTWVLSCELIHPATRQIVVELASQVTIDPFATPTPEDEFDTAVPMTRAVEALAREALTLAQPWVRARNPGRQGWSGWKVALSPAITAAQADAAEAQKDPLQAEIWMQARARFLTGWLTDATAAQLSRTPESLWVEAAPKDVAVTPGELIVKVDDESPLPEVLARRRLFGTVTLRVGQGGKEREVTVP